MNDRARTLADGGVTALAWLAGLVAVGPLLGDDPVTRLAQTVVESAPGAVATAAIEELGALARPLVLVAVATVLLATVWTASVVARRRYGEGQRGRDAARRRGGDWRRSMVRVALPATTAGLLLWTAGSPSLRWVLATALALAPLALLRWARGQRWARVGRRTVLRETGATAATVLGGWWVAGQLRPRADGPEPGDELSPVEEKTAVGTTTPAGPDARTPTSSVGLESVRTSGGVTVSVADSSAEFGFDFEGMPRRVAGADAHYVVDKNVRTPSVDAADWSLSVDGHVAEPYELSYEELTTHADARPMTVTTACISNPVGGGLISTARWRVMPLETLLRDAGVSDGAVDVVTEAVDGYTEAIPWEVVQRREDIAVAFGIDGRSLPRVHGFPARLLVPGRYGVKSTKWIERIAVVPRDHESYWERRGWDERAVVNTLSYVRAVQRRGDSVAVGGVAYAGRRGIDRVEVSLDGGTTWREADLEAPVSPHAWRRFRAAFDRPDRAAYSVFVRATDGEGNRQTEERSDPHPGGATGWHSVSVSL